MSTDSRISRKTLSIIIVIVTLFIVVLYNLPGSRRPEARAPGPVVLPQAESTQSEVTEKLSSLELIEQSPVASHPIRIESWNTNHGAKVLFVHAPEIPMLDVRLVFNAGSARDGETPGLAELTGRMLTEGAGIYDVDAIAKHFEGLGANIDTGTYRDMAIISLRTLSDPQYRDPALSVFYDIAAAPTFPVTSFERIQAQMLSELEHEKQDPGTLAAKAFFAELYANQPYGSPTNGTPESLKSLSTAMLKTFHEQYYVSTNMTVAMIGDISRADAEMIAQQLDQRLPQGAPAGELPPPAPLTAARSEHIPFPSSQTHINVGLLGVKRGTPDWYALSLGNEILGAGGFSSRLNQVIRQDNGLAYSVYSHFIPMATQGPFLINLQTRNDQTTKALELLNQTLRTFVEEGPTEQELEDAKRHLLGSFPLQTASNSNIVDYLGMVGFYDLPLNYLAEYPKKIAAVSLKDIKTAFKRVVDPGKLLTITVGQQEENHAEAP